MTTQMKQRIVGGLVLVAILAIFLPILFHQKKTSNNLKLSTEVPTAPQAPKVNLQMPTSKATVKGTVSDPQTIIIQADKPAPAKKAQSAKKKVIVPKKHRIVAKQRKRRARHQAIKVRKQQRARVQRRSGRLAPVSTATTMGPAAAQSFVVQLGSFSNAANVHRLVKRLQRSGYAAFSRRFGNLTRVYVGPVLTRSKANTLRRTLHTRFKLNGVVRPYRS